MLRFSYFYNHKLRLIWGLFTYKSVHNNFTLAKYLGATTWLSLTSNKLLLVDDGVACLLLPQTSSHPSHFRKRSQYLCWKRHIWRLFFFFLLQKQLLRAPYFEMRISDFFSSQIPDIIMTLIWGMVKAWSLKFKDEHTLNGCHIL